MNLQGWLCVMSVHTFNLSSNVEPFCVSYQPTVITYTWISCSPSCFGAYHNSRTNFIPQPHEQKSCRRLTQCSSTLYVDDCVPNLPGVVLCNPYKSDVLWFIIQEIPQIDKLMCVACTVFALIEPKTDSFIHSILDSLRLTRLTHSFESRFDH